MYAYGNMYSWNNATVLGWTMRSRLVFDTFRNWIIFNTIWSRLSYGRRKVFIMFHLPRTLKDARISYVVFTLQYSRLLAFHRFTNSWTVLLWRKEIIVEGKRCKMPQIRWKSESLFISLPSLMASCCVTFKSKTKKCTLVNCEVTRRIGWFTF